MTSVEADSKRPRLGSYEHVVTTPIATGLPPPPPPAGPPSAHAGPYQIPQHQHHRHSHHPTPPQTRAPPLQPQPHQPYPSPHTPSHTAIHHPHSHPQHQQTTSPNRPPLALHSQPPHHSQPATHQQSVAGPAPASSEHRVRPYSSHASTLPMPTQHHAESSEPSQYHHHPPPPYHSRQYSSEPLSARTPTTSAQQGPPPPPGTVDANGKHAPQYYNDPYRLTGEVIYSPYHEQQMHPALTMPPPQQSDRSLPYPSMPHQASDPPADYYSYMTPVQADGQPRRKAVRASQACESCRQKKCKCDEEKPTCSNCKAQGTQCHYRDVPPPKQERTMLQVMEQISGLAQQIHEVGTRLNHLGGSYVRRDELRGELDSSIKSILHRELRELRDDMRGVQAHVKRSSEISQSPASRSHFASPNPVNGVDSTSSSHRADNRRPYDTNQQPRDGVPAYSPAGSHSDSGVGPFNSRNTPQQHVSRKLPVALDPAIKHFDPLAGQLSIPWEHSTAAHKLLTSWHFIHPFYDGIISLDYAHNYVMRGETTRGNLRIFAQGEGSDGISQSFPPAFMKQPSTSDKDDSNSSSAASVSSNDGHWGIGFDGPTLPAVDTEGGLNPDGTLCLDVATIHRLYDSFLQNIWVMHPFLNKLHLHHVFERFVRRYGSDNIGRSAASMTSPLATGEQIDTSQFKAPKRKRSDGGIDERLSNSTGKSGLEHCRPIERSMNNALMLLILALGRMCEHKGPLPPPVTEGRAYTSYAAAKSPSFANTPHSINTPLYSAEVNTPDAVAPSPFSDSSSGRYAARPRNIDKMPGLAYFAYAIGILGEHHGCPDLVHVQANVLAGLYYGQMARVIDSWRWIHSACTDCQLLFKDENSFTHMEPDRADAIRFAYWTCLQLESDILAELDLPPSGISRFEDRMELPNWSTTTFQQKSTEHVALLYYWAQISLRKILNRAHSALYNSGKEPLKNPGWTIHSADDLAVQLDEWRKILPPSLRFTDGEDPAQDINDARLRGKYYGARYIIHRPFLHHMLEEEWEPRSQAQAKGNKGWATREKEDIIGMARNCIDAARLSTTSFDGLQGRPILTNIFGTAHAQFGNMLVLAACYASNKFRWLLNRPELDSLIDRTIVFVGNLAPLAPTMHTNLRILHNTKKKLAEYDGDAEMQNAASSSFSSAQ